jgi:hypothetical protein
MLKVLSAKRVTGLIAIDAEIAKANPSIHQDAGCVLTTDSKLFFTAAFYRFDSWKGTG